MSWSRNHRDLSLDEIRALELAPTYDNERLALDQFEAAKAAAVAIAWSGAIGDPSHHRFNVNLAGHANPGHAPTPGWANDCVTVNISQAAPAVTPS